MLPVLGDELSLQLHERILVSGSRQILNLSLGYGRCGVIKSSIVVTPLIDVLGHRVVPLASVVGA